MKQRYSALREVDAFLFLVSADQKRGHGDNFIIERLKNVEAPVFLIINKIDTIHPDALFEIIEDYQALMPFAEIMPISLRKEITFLNYWKHWKLT